MAAPDESEVQREVVLTAARAATARAARLRAEAAAHRADLAMWAEPFRWQIGSAAGTAKVFRPPAG